MISLDVVLTITVSPRMTIIPERAFNRNSRNRMARPVASEHEMQEVFAAAGKRTVVVYFFDTYDDPNRKALNTMAKDCGGSWHLAEIFKWPDSKKDELFFATQDLKRKYMPGAGTAPILVFFHDGKKVFLK